MGDIPPTPALGPRGGAVGGARARACGRGGCGGPPWTGHRRRGGGLVGIPRGGAPSQCLKAVAAFQEEFPAVPLRLNVEALGAVLQPVMEGRCAFGVMGSLPTAPAELTREQLLSVGMAFVASPAHPLASLKGPIPARVLAQHRQLVLTDRSELSQGKDFGGFSANTWRLGDLGAKHAFLRAGLGSGGMPVGVIKADLAKGSLVKIGIEGVPEAHLVMP